MAARPVRSGNSPPRPADLPVATLPTPWVEPQRLLYSVEGNGQRLDGGAMFGNAPRALWERWAQPDERNRIELACRGLLVREPTPADGGPKTGPRWILFEAGIGAFMDPQMRDRYGVEGERHILLDSLAARGVRHEQVAVVVLSHLHFDHAGGLLTSWRKSKPPDLLFPRAKYVAGKTAWERACKPHDRDRASFIPDLQALLASSGRLELVDDAVREPKSASLGPAYRFRKSDGHTPGLLLCEIPGSRGPVLFASDLVPGRPWVHRSIAMGYDRFPELLLDEKVALLDDLVDRKGRLFFTHDPSTAMARVTKDEKGRYGSARDVATVDGEAA